MVWVLGAFEPSDLATRYACLLAVADSRSEVAEAAGRALRPVAKPSSTSTAAASDRRDLLAR